ncbi:helix-turn-helix domain-containing protein [Phytoactinopolyspora endophytica]|uniref:helix-turn-helix domain-containing protein n=1 Tax=Phytoactinopolyspora endophytica TaxID=1642495 RepID=UPI00101C42EF|nr:helix-turn-helix transcriptional regulator [Phytoactinopolyspora endophytica]
MNDAGGSGSGQDWPGDYPPDLTDVLDVIEEHPEWQHTVASLAEHASLSVRTLELRFRKYLGTTPSVFLRDTRLDRINEILERSSPDDVSLDEVARDLWYSSYGYLAKLYTQRFGEEPKETLGRACGQR